MQRELRYTHIANEQLERIESDANLKAELKQVRKTLGYLETNLRAKALQTHKYESLTKRYGKEIFEAYAQQDTPGAYRVFWHYGPDEEDKNGNRIAIITIVAITPYPES